MHACVDVCVWDSHSAMDEYQGPANGGYNMP